MTTYQVEVKRYFVETGQLNKKGNPIRIPVTIRKMYLYGNFIGTKQYRVVRTQKRGTLSYTLSAIPDKKELWPTLKLVPQAEPKYKMERRMNEKEFLGWLSAILKDRAALAFIELCESEPVREAA